MKQILKFLLVLIMNVIPVRAQELVEPNKPYSYLDSTPGYITINDITLGFTSSDVSLPYSGSFFGFTTIHGYQINQYFMVGAGTGASFYENETLVPLFMHIRFTFNMHPFTPILFTEGGLLFGTQTKEVLFINPGIGIRYSLNHKLAIHFGTGLFVISGPSMESFINLRFGFTLKPSNSASQERTERK